LEPYDWLIVAVGARRECFLADSVLTFGGAESVEPFRLLLDRIENGALRGTVTRLAVVVPPGPGWPLPAYELALQTADRLDRAGLRHGAEITLVTAEPCALAAFGTAASAAVEERLDRAGITLRSGAVVREWAFGRLRLLPSGEAAADRVVSLPSLRGPAVPGLPSDSLGFVRTDADARVEGLDEVFAIGDAGTFPLKQGGIACQQADRVASLIARELGAAVEPVSADPVLRAALLTGDQPLFLRSDVAGGRDESRGVSSEDDPLWWPPVKVAGRFLAPYLAGCGPGAELRDTSPAL
jgi:sulfide:quinone oxidoreductase